MAFCTQCGGPVAGDASFCATCGTQTNETLGPAQSLEAHESEQRSRSWPIPIAAIVVLTIAILGAGAWFGSTQLGNSGDQSGQNALLTSMQSSAIDQQAAPPTTTPTPTTPSVPLADAITVEAEFARASPASDLWHQPRWVSPSREYWFGSAERATGSVCAFSLTNADDVCVRWDGSIGTGVSWSPDGSKVAFSENHFTYGDESDIWILDATTGNLVDITDDNSVDHRDDGAPRDYLPIWSLDGNSIFFFRLVDSGESDSITLSRFDVTTGQVDSTLTAPGYPVPAPIWLENGSLAVYVGGQGREGVWTVNPETGTQSFVVSPGTSVQLISALDNSHLLAWECCGQPSVPIVLDMNSGERRPCCAHKGNDLEAHYVSILPDARTLLLWWTEREAGLSQITPVSFADVVQSTVALDRSDSVYSYCFAPEGFCDFVGEAPYFPVWTWNREVPMVDNSALVQSRFGEAWGQEAEDYYWLRFGLS